MLTFYAAGKDGCRIRNGGFEMEDRSMSVEEYAQLLEGFICQSWLWPDFICFGKVVLGDAI